MVTKHCAWTRCRGRRLPNSIGLTLVVRSFHLAVFTIVEALRVSYCQSESAIELIETAPAALFILCALPCGSTTELILLRCVGDLHGRLDTEVHSVIGRSRMNIRGSNLGSKFIISCAKLAAGSRIWFSHCLFLR